MANSNLQNIRWGRGTWSEEECLAAQKRRKGGEGLSKCPTTTVTNPAKKKKISKLVLSDQGGTRVGEREN